MIDEKYIADLNDTNAIEGTIEGLDANQLGFRESEDRWSIMLVLEHILITEMAIAQLILSLEGEKSDKTEVLGYGKVGHLVVKREIKAKVPSFLAPPGKLDSPSEFLKQLKANRKMLEDKITAPGFTFSGKTRNHMLLGDLGAIDWLSFLTGHSERHRLQIEEIKGHADFPS